jgi:hypothetical protein
MYNKVARSSCGNAITRPGREARACQNPAAGHQRGDPPDWILRLPLCRVSPVLLFLPPGALGGSQLLFRELTTKTGSTFFLPTARWLTAEPESLRARNRLEHLISERLAQLEGEGPIQPPLRSKVPNR